MRVVLLGASGNVGTSLLHALEEEARVDEVVAVARRPPASEGSAKVRWVEADIRDHDLGERLRGADVVVHLAWMIQPSRDVLRLWDVNVVGSANVFRAVADAGVPVLVYASSVGAYSPGPAEERVDEEWPTHGVATSSYSRAKAYVERLLDSFEADNPRVRVVRFRPALIFKREAASEIRRFFGGSLLPNRLLRPSVIPAVPHLEGVRFQAVHSLDIGDAYRRAVVDGDVHGAFNLAAEPVLDLAAVAESLKARAVRVPARLLRAGADLSWRMRIHSVEPGWLDLARESPVMDVTRARETLGWEPQRSATDALEELLEGMRQGAGAPTPTLEPDAERSRLGELRTGQGSRYTEDEETLETPGRR